LRPAGQHVSEPTRDWGRLRVAVVDTNGLPVHLAVAPGEAHDNRLCSPLLSALLDKSSRRIFGRKSYPGAGSRSVAEPRLGVTRQLPPADLNFEQSCVALSRDGALIVTKYQAEGVLPPMGFLIMVGVRPPSTEENRP